MTITYEQIITRLEEIEGDISSRQSKGEDSASRYYNVKRDFEMRYAQHFVSGSGGVTERKHQATRAMEQDPLYFELKEAEAAFEGWRAVMRALEARASIGQSLLRAQRETGG